MATGGPESGRAPGSGQEPPRPGSVRPTSRRLLVAIAVLCTAIGFTMVRAIEAGGGVAPAVSWLTLIAWAFLAALLLAAARNTHQRVQVRRERIEASRAVFLLLIGKASAFVGALCTGVYAGFALSFLRGVSASGPRNRVIMAGLAAVISVLVVTAGLLLERACRIPEDPDQTA
ncbi:DUF3180 domain-containing protein [Kribbella sandramycini]|uniref:DUF3180 domain-containing protein n=1 Tax=Kribbella sandramycini TaxID=60450 RepID=A0A7Y4L377_9ACTN|nr:putative membrane protein [Kribbella sandramycini]NOL42642.1 DUF3180 domain-containing protein [Kribbella sandramycini]